MTELQPHVVPVEQACADDLVEDLEADVVPGQCTRGGDQLVYRGLVIGGGDEDRVARRGRQVVQTLREGAPQHVRLRHPLQQEVGGGFRPGTDGLRELDERERVPGRAADEVLALHVAQVLRVSLQDQSGVAIRQRTELEDRLVRARPIGRGNPCG